jgi:hypothetical protein
MKVSASKILFGFNKEELLSMEKDRNYIFYYTHKNNRVFIDLSRIYWKNKLRQPSEARLQQMLSL